MDRNSVLQLLFVQVISLLLLFPASLAQIHVNGQLFTRGLSIINAPNLNSEYQAGSLLPISIDVSGDGTFSESGRTSYAGLNIFMVSAQTMVNMTVSSGPDLLNGETGTVRHLNWPIPTCIKNGIYNLTFYETSMINDAPYFIITPVPITIRNTGGVDSCADEMNGLQPQPQADSPPLESPFLPGQQTSINTGGPYSGAYVSPTITFTITANGNLPWGPTVARTDPASITTVTAVVISATTITTTLFGQSMPTTLASSTTWTTTALIISQDLSGFIPVNNSQKLVFNPLLNVSFLCVLFIHYL